MPRRFKKIDKVFEKIIGKSEIESVSSNENENDIIENENVYLDEENELDKYNKSDYILERIYNIFSHLKNIFNFIFGVSGIYLLWICLHYFASHLYVKFCVPTTIMGFVLSPFMTSTPHCQGLRWVVYNAANMINNMWLVLGTWIGSILLNFNTYVSHGTSS
jgi:hypothetical protein